MLKAQHISMLEFCRTGRFGTLNAGASQDDMIEYLGEPSSWNNGKRKEFCHYADVQIFFNVKPGDRPVAIEVSRVDARGVVAVGVGGE